MNGKEEKDLEPSEDSGPEFDESEKEKQQGQIPIEIRQCKLATNNTEELAELLLVRLKPVLRPITEAPRDPSGDKPKVSEKCKLAGMIHLRTLSAKRAGTILRDILDRLEL